MSQHRIPLTPEGYEKLKAELKPLQNVERPKIIKEIATARAHGDISENAEYHAAKERQSFTEGRIQDLQVKIGRAEVIDVSKHAGDKVIFGATVKIEDIDSGEVFCYKLVGTDEADLKENKISVSSPIGKALIGKSIDAEVRIQTPGGIKEFNIVDVKFA